MRILQGGEKEKERMTAVQMMFFLSSLCHDIIAQGRR